MGIVNRRQCTKSTLNMSRLIQSANRVRLFESILLQYLAKKTDLNLRTLQKESTFSNYYLQFKKAMRLPTKISVYFVNFKAIKESSSFS